MGLDNGIIMRNYKIEDIPYFIQYEVCGEMYNDPYIELCYWRKCWGLRNEIMNVVHCCNCDETKIDSEDIPAIIRIITKFMRPDYWEEHSESIWTYDEIVQSLIQDCIRLSWLKEYMEHNKDVEVTWYDSY